MAKRKDNYARPKSISNPTPLCDAHGNKIKAKPVTEQNSVEGTLVELKPEKQAELKFNILEYDPTMTGHAPKAKSIASIEGKDSKALGKVMVCASQPKVDLLDPEKVAERLNWYFLMLYENNTKPTMASLCLALGLNRRRFVELRSNPESSLSKDIRNAPPETLEMIRKANEMLEGVWEENMVNGDINPVTGIFLGKNQFGYKDQVSTEITATTDVVDMKLIGHRYGFLEEED